jgi:hypothetical protein
MTIIKIQTTETATGKVKKVYDAVLKNIPLIPKPLQLMSASPALIIGYAKGMEHYMNHAALSPLLLAHIRLLVAINIDYPYCIEFNINMLKMLGGLSNEQIAATRQDPSQAALPEKDKALLLFTLKVVSEPEEVNQADMDTLHKLDWEDPDIFDAVNHGVTMVSMGILFNAFKMHEPCEV